MVRDKTPTDSRETKSPMTGRTGSTSYKGSPRALVTSPQQKRDVSAGQSFEEPPTKMRVKKVGAGRKGRKKLMNDSSDTEQKPRKKLPWPPAYIQNMKEEYQITPRDTKAFLAPDGTWPTETECNRVDGYKQARAFLAAAGPLFSTEREFWRLVWQEKVRIVVMLTKPIENNRIMCDQYWPDRLFEKIISGRFQIKNFGLHDYDDVQITILEIHNTQTNEKRYVQHFLFRSWPEDELPNALCLLKFMTCVRRAQSESIKKEYWPHHPMGPPIVVHCSDGLKRTGAFIAIDMGIQMIDDLGECYMDAIIARIKRYRPFTLEPFYHDFCDAAAKLSVEKKDDLRRFALAIEKLQ